MILIKDIMEPRSEVIEGRFQGVIQSHKADSKEKCLESNARELFKINYVSSALKRAIERINEKLTGISNQGAFLLVGPYGSGNTHGLITLYRLLRESQSAEEWLRDWRIEVILPSFTKTLKRRLEHLNILLHLLQMIKITLIY
ncbi:MAG: hypothetical protein ACUVWJ_06295 [Spirochaetota bacterium]